MASDAAGDQTGLIENVRAFDREQREHAHRIKTLKEQMKEIEEGTDEYAAVESLKRQLKEAKDRLRYKLLSLGRYNDLAEKLAEEKHLKQEAEVEISDFLLAYHAETRERQIELAAGDAREVVLSARLGKPKDYQMGLFTEAAGDARQAS